LEFLRRDNSSLIQNTNQWQIYEMLSNENERLKMNITILTQRLANAEKELASNTTF
jgi:hypothetical protein